MQVKERFYVQYSRTQTLKNYYYKKCKTAPIHEYGYKMAKKVYKEELYHGRKLIVSDFCVRCVIVCHTYVRVRVFSGKGTHTKALI